MEPTDSLDNPNPLLQFYHFDISVIYIRITALVSALAEDNLRLSRSGGYIQIPVAEYVHIRLFVFKEEKDKSKSLNSHWANKDSLDAKGTFR